MNGLTLLIAFGAGILPGLLDVAVKSTILLLLAAAAAAILRRSAASLRHLVWGLGVVGVLALPVLSVALPQWTVTVLPSIGAPDPVIAVPTANAVVTAAVRPVTSVPASRTVRAAIAPRPARRVDARAAQPARRDLVAPVAESAAPIAPLTRGERRAEPLGIPSVPWTAWIFPAWAAGLLLVMGGILAGLGRIARLQRVARPVRGGARRAIARELTAALRIRRSVRLLEIDGPAMPMTWGAWRPVVLLPSESAVWEDARLRAVLLHELAHVKRYDFLTQLLARVACAIYWFNPLSWVASRCLRAEREMACDDLVLSRGALASDYAGHLLDIARVLRPTRLSTVATVCMARPSQLRTRLHAILDATRRRAMVTPGFAVPAIATTLAVVLPLAAASAARVDRDPIPAAVNTATIAPAIEAVAAVDAASVKPATLKQGLLERLRDFVVGDAPPAAAVVWSGAQSCDWDTRSDHMSASTRVDDHVWRVRIEIGSCELRIDAEGDVTFTDDDRDVAGIARNGFFSIEERYGRTRRRMEMRPSGSGEIERRWFVDGTEQWTAAGPLATQDPDAAAWLARVLPVVFRRTGINAEARAKRILERDGVDGLLQEISFIRSDWAAGKYYAVLLSQPNLDGATIQRVVRDAGRQIESDYTLGQLLIAVAEHQTIDANVQAAYVEAAGSIESDYQHAQVLRAILRREGISQELADAMLRSAKNIDSDYQRTQVLMDVIAAHPLTQALTPAFLDAVRDIESDYQQTQVIMVLLQKGAPDVAVLDDVLALTSNIDSDHQLGAVLLKVAELYPVETALPASYLRAATSIESSYTRGRVLRTLLARDGVTEATAASILDAASTIDSDHELGGLLADLAQRGPLSPALRRSFFSALGNIESDHTQSTVLGRVIEHQTLDNELVRAILAATTRGIDSDHSLGQVLIKLAAAGAASEALRADFLRAIDQIESEHTRGQVLNALYPRRGG
ncbi:MAG TPA: M56 family metallopeptidase [Gemmatimonadales bacterium]